MSDDPKPADPSEAMAHHRAMLAKQDRERLAGPMRRFELHRDEDVSGVSGTGIVAEGVAFSAGGPVALRWTSEWPTSVVFHDRGVESLEAVHGHNGRTRIVWLDASPVPDETSEQP